MTRKASGKAPAKSAKSTPRGKAPAKRAADPRAPLTDQERDRLATMRQAIAQLDHYAKIATFYEGQIEEARRVGGPGAAHVERMFHPFIDVIRGDWNALARALASGKPGVVFGKVRRSHHEGVRSSVADALYLVLDSVKRARDEGREIPADDALSCVDPIYAFHACRIVAWGVLGLDIHKAPPELWMIQARPVVVAAMHRELTDTSDEHHLWTDGPRKASWQCAARLLGCSARTVASATSPTGPDNLRRSLEAERRTLEEQATARARYDELAARYNERAAALHEDDGTYDHSREAALTLAIANGPAHVLDFLLNPGNRTK